MALDQDIALLARVSLFQGFSPEQLRLIAFGAKKTTLNQSQILYNQGDVTNGGFVVESGRIELVGEKSNSQIKLGSYTTGSVVGMMSLITANERIGTAYASEQSSVMLISRETFMRVLEEYPELAGAIHEKISSSLSDLMSELNQINKKFAG